MNVYFLTLLFYFLNLNKCLFVIKQYVIFIIIINAIVMKTMMLKLIQKYK
jgi:hypothetical protein